MASRKKKGGRRINKHGSKLNSHTLISGIIRSPDLERSRSLA
jgi:hypothetical protein